MAGKSTKANGTSELARSLGVSRQRAWQILKRKAGKCIICGEKAVFSQHCKAHRIAKNKQNEAYIERQRQSA